MDSYHYVGRLIWARSEVSVKASLTLHERGEGRNKKRQRKRLAVIVPAKWKFIKKIERFQDETQKEEACELLPNWESQDLISLIGHESFAEPPITTKAQLERLDCDARNNEVDRTLNIPVMVEVEPGEVEQQNGYGISTKFVFTWTHRLEQGGQGWLLVSSRAASALSRPLGRLCHRDSRHQ